MVSSKYTLTYELSKILKSYNIYSMNTQKSIVCEPFTDIIRIENFRGFSNGKGFDKYLRFKNCSNWNKSEKVTGLLPFKNIFYGDRKDVKGNKSLIVFSFIDSGNTLNIDYYPFYYPNIIELQNVLETYVKQ